MEGEDDYINCPMTKEEYLAFYNEFVLKKLSLMNLKTARYLRMYANRGYGQAGEDTIRFGPLKPVGLPDPKTGQEPYAVVQLRQDDARALFITLLDSRPI